MTVAVKRGTVLYIKDMDVRVVGPALGNSLWTTLLTPMYDALAEIDWSLDYRRRKGLPMTTGLQQEIATHERNKGEWSAHTGKFVLIKGDDVAGFYSTYEDAITEGYKRFQLNPFLVKQVSMIERSCFVAPLARTSDATLHAAN